jgi:muramoyltetrapeptide carboxypeptidase
MLDDKEVNAVLFGRGGYGLSRIINNIDFDLFIKKPKWLIGFSDITILHAHLNSQLKIASLHAPMAAAFSDEGYKNQYVQSIRQLLAGEKIVYNCNTHHYNRKGTSEGELIGGNLTLIAHLIGSSSSYVNTSGKILFLEDVGEYLYNIDRLLIQLKNNDFLSNLSGVIIGGFTDMKDTITPFGEDVYTIIYNQFKKYNYPICFNFPVGHQTNNYALKIGCSYQLTIGDAGTSLIEIT